MGILLAIFGIVLILFGVIGLFSAPLWLAAVHLGLGIGLLVVAAVLRLSEFRDLLRRDSARRSVRYGGNILLTGEPKNYSHVLQGQNEDQRREVGPWWLRIRRYGIYYWIERSQDGRNWKQLEFKGPIPFAGDSVMPALYVMASVKKRFRFTFTDVELRAAK